MIEIPTWLFIIFLIFLIIAGIYIDAQAKEIKKLKKNRDSI